MKIGIEAERANQLQKTGVEHYAQQLIMHLAAQDHIHEYVLYLRTKPQSWLLELPKNFQVKVMPFPIFWTQLRISLEMILHPVDVLFIPASALPLIHPKKSVVTIHDLAWKFFPETFTWFNRNFLRFSTWFAVRSASAIIAVSESTQKDLQKFYGISKKKINVVYHGYSLQSVDKKNDNSEHVSMRGKLPEKYILFLSTLQPRKNLERLILAFQDLKRQFPELTERLVVVGKPGWKFESILKALEENKEQVVYLNHVSEWEKAYVLSHAEALVVPSLYEGFGMQILEAFAAKVPVITSNISSMPEVAGNAAAYFNPLDKNDMSKTLQHVLLDKSLRESLVQNGTERLKLFDWNICAQETLSVFTKD